MSIRYFLYQFFQKILLHSLFWIIVYIFFSYCFEEPTGIPKDLNRFSVFLMPVTIGTTYTIIYYLIPKFLLKKRYFVFGIYSFYTLILSAYAIILSIFYGLIFLTGQAERVVSLNRSLVFTLLAVYMVVFFVTAFRLLKYNYSAIAQTKELENKFLLSQLKLKEQELKYLKLQIHPHFLFNTLNTMYGYALKKSEETPEMILKLSNLLDYLLYQVDKPMVSLSSEIAHIKDYIDLERIRFSDTLEVELDIDNYDYDIDVAPMLLIPFVENSFKHGDIVDNKLMIFMRLNVGPEEMNFKVKNSVIEVDPDIKENGIGLWNIRKRLDLLYPDSYKLSIKAEKNCFEVELKLNHAKVNYDE
ncbi:histidine kinase [Mangrovivirga sp. M17]|uniref:Histidine kinase n=1 Tax=Mangrovivirga halotolerans TaxID=2993936 RepID=A0ABT3RUQ4_9BACT|nr:histidine kinase [Mangrovivirga halotolerans]MCX2745499.1 histidine kinase [Mangrovivirga halotolerans]